MTAASLRLSPRPDSCLLAILASRSGTRPADPSHRGPPDKELTLLSAPPPYPPRPHGRARSRASCRPSGQDRRQLSTQARAAPRGAGVGRHFAERRPPPMQRKPRPIRASSRNGSSSRRIPPRKAFLPRPALPTPARGSVDPHWDVGESARSIPAGSRAHSLAPEPRGASPGEGSARGGEPGRMRERGSGDFHHGSLKCLRRQTLVRMG